MSNYRTNNGWIDLVEVFKELKPLMDMVRHIPLSHNKDSIVWGETTNGIYTVASGYETP